MSNELRAFHTELVRVRKLFNQTGEVTDGTTLVDLMTKLSKGEKELVTELLLLPIDILDMLV